MDKIVSVEDHNDNYDKIVIKMTWSDVLAHCWCVIKNKNLTIFFPKD